ncbi:MAG TPA: hypothetical protein VFK52_10785 [Nocardioidaceae bacterium]|nr:hypothetical protein [Nocardioidaceae bacterium]
MSGTISFCGEQLRLADKVGMMPVMRLARAQQRIAGKGQVSDADAAEVMVAMLDVVEQCIADEDIGRFEHLATAHRVGTTEIEEFLDRVMRAVADRPTGRSSDSSAGPRTIEPSSTDDSSSPATGPDAVIDRLNGQGRPDLALVVRRRQESLAS